MPIFLAQVSADSTVRIHPQHVIPEQGTTLHLTYEAVGVDVVAFDETTTRDGYRFPSGLVANLRFDAVSLPEALERVPEFASHTFSLFSFVSRAGIGRVKIRWIYDASPDTKERDFLLQFDVPSFSLLKRGLPDKVLFHLLDRLYDHLFADPNVKEDRKTRVLRSVQSFRRALADNDDALTEFLIHWTSLETMDVVYRELFDKDADPVYTTCKGCGTEFRDCPRCEERDVFLRRRELVGVRDIFERLDKSELFGELSRLRNGLSHGYISLSDGANLVNEHLEDLRTAVLLMVFCIAGGDLDLMEYPLRKHTLTGHTVPYVRVFGHGDFDPGDLNSLEGHPGLEVGEENVEVIYDEVANTLNLSPTRRMTSRNTRKMTVDRQELWGEGESPVRITKFDHRVIRGKDETFA
jgi:hypothetical protein